MRKYLLSLIFTGILSTSGIAVSLEDLESNSGGLISGERPYLAQRKIGISPDHEQTKAATDRYAVIIGIGSYQDQKIPRLEYAVRDAQAMYRVLVDPDCGGFPKGHVKLLTDAHATVKNIKRHIGKWLRNRAKENDLVIVYYAGHGAVEEGETYWVTHEADINDLYSTALSSDDIARMFDRVKAKRMVAFLDSCYSAATVHRTGRRRAVITGDPFAEFKGKGRVTITSSDGKQTSLELAELGHGVFTYYLIEALNGNADSNRDGAVLLDEVWGYLKDRVTQTALKHGSSQTPIIDGTFSSGFILSKNPAVLASNEKRLVILSDLLGGRQITLKEYSEMERLLKGNIQTEADEKLLTFVQFLCDGRFTVDQYRENRRRIMVLAKIGERDYDSPKTVSPPAVPKPVEPEVLEPKKKVSVPPTTPKPTELKKVRIGVSTALGKKYLSHLMDEIRKKPNCEVIRLMESTSYDNLDIYEASILKQRYQIDMLIGVKNVWQSGRGYNGYTKLIDISGQRLVKLDPVDTGFQTPSPGWEKKLVRKQIGSIEEMIDQISRERRKPEEVDVPPTTRQQAGLRKVRIGVLTKLERGYFTHLKEVLRKRPNCQLVELFDPISYDNLDLDAARSLEKEYRIDMIIGVKGLNQWTLGGLMIYTKLVDISSQRLVKLDRINLGRLGPNESAPYGWEKKIVRKQIRSIEKMINEIHREKTRSKKGTLSGSSS